LDQDLKDEQIVLPGSYNFEERKIYRESLVTILQARQQEIFEIILRELSIQPFWEDFAGTIYLTGGASEIRGLTELASEIFPYPVEMGNQAPFDGDQNYASRPDLATVLGLLQYARQAEMEMPQARGFARVGESVRKMLAGMKLFVW
jgi:cell division protein FtsA